jgi:hypothetical protein
MKKIILQTLFETGLGDFYTNLLSVKIGCDKLEKLGYSVEVRLNSNTYYYGKEDTLLILKNCFDFNTFKSFSIDNPIPKEFSFYKNIQHSYNIYIENGIDTSLIDNINLYQYCCEKICEGNPYPENLYREDMSILSKTFLSDLESHIRDLGEFSTIFLRYPDTIENITEEELNNLKITIKEKHKKDNHNYFISSRVGNINNIKIDGINIKNIDIRVLNNYNRIYRDLLNMCIFYRSEKIYYKWGHWSNYVTFGLIHNKKLKNFDEFLYPLI